MQSQPNSSRVIIIGGGLAGLATAALLAKIGWQVTLYEKNRDLGGRARVFKQQGFTFDMGPSWYMMPEVFEHFFSLFNRRVNDFYQLVRLDQRYSIFFGDDTKVVFADQTQTQRWFESLEAGAGQKLADYLARMKRIYTAVGALLYEDWGNWRSWLKFSYLSQFVEIISLQRFWRSWQSEVASLFAEPRLQQALSFLSVFLGGSPYNTPAIYSMLNWADVGAGVWYPKGGMNQLVTALSRLAKEQGVEIVTNADVSRILIDRGRVIGVEVNQTVQLASHVVGASDIPWLEMHLLPAPYQKKRSEWEAQTMGISALMVYLGLNKRLKHVTHHMLYLSKNWKENFDDVFEHQTLPVDPSLYISVRSVTDRAIVPPGNEEVVLLIPLGAGGTYSAKALRKYADRAIAKIETLIGEEITPHIVVKHLYTPSDFERDYHAFKGSALGLAHTLLQSVWWRPSLRHPQIKGLWYAGQYSQPGIGVPMAIISAELIAKSLGRYTTEKSEQIFRRSSITYYYSSTFFPAEVRDKVTHLYAYVRYVDDLVDQMNPNTTEMDSIWHETVQAWKKGASARPLVANFVNLAKAEHFEWQWIEAFWHAMRQDVTKKKYASYEELEAYMYGSAEVIGLMMAKILRLPVAAQKAAMAQGKAMQLINFVRDVAEDEILGRNYLGYASKMKLNHENWSTMIRGWIDTYHDLQRQAEAGYRFIPRRYLIPIKTAAEMYSWTAHQLYQDPSLVWRQKVKPSKLRVVLTVIKNTIGL